MKSYIATWALAFVLLASPFAAKALTQAELTAQIQTLLNQVSQLQQQLTTTTTTNVNTNTSSNTCPTLTRTLSFGSRGSDVGELQQFLANNGYLSIASATGYFGVLTEQAVQQWQAHNGVVYGGDRTSSGFGVVGARTRQAIASVCRQTVVTSCPQYQIPQCSTGYHLQSNGTDSNGCTRAASCVADTVITSCQIAPQPTSACSTGWQAVTDSNGCTLSYKCVTPVVTTCPINNTPICPTGYTLTSGGTDSNGCALIGKCVQNPTDTTPSVRVSIDANAATQGTPIHVSWSATNAPTPSVVQLSLIDAATGSVVGDGVICGNSNIPGTCTWTVPNYNNSPLGYCGRNTDMAGVCGSDLTQGKSYFVRASLQSGFECRGYCQYVAVTKYASYDSTPFTLTTLSM